MVAAPRPTATRPTSGNPGAQHPRSRTTAVVLGLALGRRFPSIAIARAAGVAVCVFLVVPIYFPSLAFIGRLTPFGSTSSAYAGPTPMYSLLQCGAGIAVAAWLWPRSSSRRATTLAACAALSLVALNGPSAEHIDSRATRVTCKESSAFTLCLTCPRERDRARLSSILATAFGRLAPLYPPTTTIVQTVASDNAPAPAGSTPVLSTAAVGLPLETGDTFVNGQLEVPGFGQVEVPTLCGVDQGVGSSPPRR